MARSISQICANASFAFVRSGLLGKLQRREPLDRQEQGLAVFGVLATVWTGYTAAGGIYFFGWRTLAGLNELWNGDIWLLRQASMLVALVGGAGLALAAALIFVQALTRGYRWAERRGLLAEPHALAGDGPERGLSHRSGRPTAARRPRHLPWAGCASAAAGGGAVLTPDRARVRRGAAAVVLRSADSLCSTGLPE